MSKVIVDISMSLDGYVTGPGPDLEHGLGHGGEPLHAWALSGKGEADEAIIRESLGSTGAVVMGRRTFDFVDGPSGWGEEMAFGGERDGSELPHNIVVTHEAPESVRLDGAFSFATDGLAAAIRQAREVAGDRDVTVMGGGDLCSQCVREGLADEVRIHLAPIVLGRGTRLFPTSQDDDGPIVLEPIDVTGSKAATHLHYRVIG